MDLLALATSLRSFALVQSSPSTSRIAESLQLKVLAFALHVDVKPTVSLMLVPLRQSELPDRANAWVPCWSWSPLLVPSWSPPFPLFPVPP